jgi:isoquinoline 1-oxidoreductase beta subunit
MSRVARARGILPGVAAESLFGAPVEAPAGIVSRHGSETRPPRTGAETIMNESRRTFLKTASAGALLLPVGAPAASREAFVPGAWLRIDANDTVTVIVGQTEMGQGIATGLAQVLAEELEVAWDGVRFEFGTGHPDFHNRVLNPAEQVTGGSRSMQAFFAPMRKAGAQAREMLRAAAAQRWRAPLQDCVARDGSVVNVRSARLFSFGDLATHAARLPVPTDPPLKQRAAWRLIGRPLPRLDTRDKVRGTAVFGIDVILPGLAHAAVRHAPVFGAEVAAFGAEQARAMPGVIAAMAVPGGVAVVAESWWQAQAAVDAMDVAWSATGRDSHSSATFTRALEAALQDPDPPVAVARGDFAAVAQGAEATVEATYTVPYLAHAALEPVNATARVIADRCELWAPTQAPTLQQRTVAAVLGLDAAQVRVHMCYAGGGFGRKGAPDAAVEAALLSKAVGRPVKVVWSREEDMRADFYRPANAVCMTAAVDRSGALRGLECRVAGSGPLRFNRPMAVKDGVDPMSVVGLTDLPYALDALRVTSAEVQPPVRVGMWRGTSNTQNTFFLESFVDELAHRAGADPHGYRRAMLGDDARSLAVLDRAVREAGWEARSDARPMGVAFCKVPRWLTRAALVCELARAGEALRIARLTCVVDSGLVVNPALATAQVEGAIAYALTAALWGEITIAHGRVQQGNFDDCRVLRMGEMPDIRVHLVEGDETPGSFGEVGVPLVAPALCNAIFRATGRRLRALPLAGAGIVFA